MSDTTSSESKQDTSPITTSFSDISDFFDERNSPESKQQREKAAEERKQLADEIMMDVLNKDISELKKDLTISCLRKNINLYKNYAETIKEHPEYQKYLQIYHYKEKDFLIVPTFNKSENQLTIKTVEIRKRDNDLEIVSEPFRIPEHPYTRESNTIPIAIEDNTQQYWYHRISMNKRTWEISDIDPASYRQDEKWIEWLISTIWEKADSKFKDCSEWLQSQVREILSKEDELKQESHNFEQEKNELMQHIMSWNLSWAINSFINIAKSFFKRKEQWRIVDIWKWITYEWDDKDIKYLESAINTVLDPEQRSKLTYLLSKIKDNHMKEWLKEKWIENPSQFDLFLQQLQPGQIMLTNALDLEWQSSSFKYATQAVSWWRWCHALIVSDIIKDNNWIITDAKIIQSTLKWWVHETTLKKYVNENYSSADLLLANVPDEKKDDIIKNAKNKIGQKYDRVSIVTDSVLWYDFDIWLDGKSPLWSTRDNMLWKDKAYCSELVFDAMEKSGLKMPEPHISPSDLLMSDEITPQYTCYCNSF